MQEQSRHVSASLRLLDTEQRGLGTISRVRPNLTSENVSRLKQGVNLLRTTPATNAALTVTTELQGQGA